MVAGTRAWSGVRKNRKERCFNARMKFRIEKDSSIPVGTQVKERIRIGLSLGELRAGDTLPSIRDLESATGIGRAIIRKAYLELEEQGILEIKHGRRVTISESVQPRANETGLRLKLDAFIQETLTKAGELRLNEVSFARYLLSRAVEQSRESNQLIYLDRSKNAATAAAAAISRLWDIPITAVSFDELPGLLKRAADCPRKVITSYYRLDEALTMVKKLGLEKVVGVIPTGWVLSEEMKARIRKVPKGNKVLLIAEEDEYKRNGQSFADVYQKEFSDHKLSFVVAPMKDEQTVAAALRSPKYKLVIMSNHLWDELPEACIKNRKLMHPVFEVDKSALEQARVRVGILQ